MAGSNSETIHWFELKSPLGLGPGQWLLAKRGDGKVYTGEIVEFGPATITLGSGNQRQVLQLSNYRYWAALIGGPEKWTLKVAERKLPL